MAPNGSEWLERNVSNDRNVSAVRFVNRTLSSGSFVAISLPTKLINLIKW